MSKLKPLVASRIDSSLFHGDPSYKAALYAIEVCNELIDCHNSGHIVFHYDDIIKPEFELRYDKDNNFKELLLKDSERSWVCIIGDIVHEQSNKIYCTKKEVREFFKHWKVAEVINVFKITNLVK